MDDFSNIKHSIFNFLKNPLSLLSLTGILIISTSRFAYSIISALAIIFVYLISTIIIFAAKKLLPKNDSFIVVVFLSSFISSLFYLLLSLINPFLASNIVLVIFLIPILYTDSPVYTHIKELDFINVMFNSIFDAGSRSLLLIIFAVFRELIAYGSISLPSSTYGITFLFKIASYENNSMQFLIYSGGSLILFGYVLVLLKIISKKQDKKNEK